MRSRQLVAEGSLTLTTCGTKHLKRILNVYYLVEYVNVANGVAIDVANDVPEKLFACEARGPGFDSRSRYYGFRDWLSPAPSRDMAGRSQKRRKSSKQPTNQANDIPFSF